MGSYFVRLFSDIYTSVHCYVKKKQLKKWAKKVADYFQNAIKIIAYHHGGVYNYLWCNV